MKKILILFLVLMSLGLFAQIKNQNYSNYRFKFYEVILNGDSLFLGSGQNGQLIRFDGNKWTNWTHDLYVDTLYYRGDSLYLVQGIKRFGFPVTVDTSHVRGLRSFVEQYSINEESLYLADSTNIKQRLRNLEDSLTNIYTESQINNLLGNKADTAIVLPAIRNLNDSLQNIYTENQVNNLLGAKTDSSVVMPIIRFIETDSSNVLHWSDTTNYIITPYKIETFKYQNIDFDSTYIITGSEKTGQMFWNQAEKTISVKLPDGGTSEVNQELGNNYHNLSGQTLYNGDVVSVIGASGNRVAITLTNVTDSTALAVLGMVTVDSIPKNQVGRVTTFGEVRGLNTNSYNENDKLYVDPLNPGKWTKVKPDAPNYTVCIGTVTVKNANVGVVELSIKVYPKLEDLSNVDGTPLTTTGQIPVWNQDSSYFDFDYNINDFTTTDSLGYYVKQAMATSVDNSLLKTVGTSGRSVEQTGVTVSDGNIVSAPTFSATNLTDGYIPYHISDALGQGNSGAYWDAVNSRIGIGTTTPTNIISLGNNAARKIWIENSATDVIGRSLTVSAGSTIAGTAVSDVVGGSLILQSGLGTGTGTSTISFQTGTTLTTGTTLQTMSTKMTILGNGNVGIGTTAPNQKLEIIAGNIWMNHNSNLYTILDRGATNNRNSLLFVTAGNSTETTPTTGLNWALGSPDSDNAGDGSEFFIGTGIDGTNSKFWIESNGNIGIGCTSPTSKLSVLGQSSTNLNLFNYVNADINKVRTNFGLATDSSSTSLTSTSTGNLTLKITDKAGNTQFKSDSTLTTAPTFSATNLTDGYIPYHISDALGQGNTTMSYDPVNNEIELAGNQVLTNTTNASKFGIIYKDANPFIHNFNYGNNGTVTTEGGNLFIGENAGNLTMGSNATQTYHSSYNVFTGYLAGYANTTGYANVFTGYLAGYANTTGYYNIFTGNQAGRSNTTGSANVFTGNQAGHANTTGYANIFTGYRAGYANTTGYNNVFTGYRAGYANTTGYNNVFTGNSAGRYLADGVTANDISNTSVFIGNDTRALSSGNNNQIVIGASAIGKGSNTVVLGNTSIVGTYLQGNVGVSCNNPTSKLSVLGTTSTNNNLFNFVHDTNKVRTTFADATDSSSVHASSTSTGSPEFHIVGKTGNQLFLQDSVKTVMGSTTNNTSFESDGSMLMSGTATVFDDLFFPFESGESGVTNIPVFVADSSYYTFTVDSTGVSKCIKYFTIQMPHSWKEGSDIFPHVHYKHETAVGTPKFMMKYKWYNTGESTAFGWNWYKMEATTGTDNNTVQMSYNSSNGISGSGKTISSILICQVYLSAAPANVNAYQFDIHIEMDRLGSRSETSK